MVKLNRLGIKGNLLAWLEIFLKERSQKVRVQGCLSAPVKVKSGVPQGSVSGPLLFLVMMIDIDHQLTSCTIATYADDTKIWGTVQNQEDAHRIQTDLTKLYTWASTNNMEFNTDKFEYLTFSKQEPSSPSQYTTSVGTDIALKTNINDLGVTFSRSGKFQTHIATMVRAAQRLSHWVLRTFRTRDSHQMKILLKLLIIPKLEYASPLWYPTDRTGINLIRECPKGIHQTDE